VLRVRHQRPNLVLADYFDLIGGTSTGALIATGLALGMDVSTIARLYQDLVIPSSVVASCGWIAHALTRCRSNARCARHSAITR
jgi:hypothetical protein